MTDKELKKLSRLKLLELLLEQSKENEQLRQDNEAYRRENESLQNQPVMPAAVDPGMLTNFSEFAEKIDSSLSETRKATQSYINRLAVLAEYAEKSVASASATQKKARSSELRVTDEAILPEVEEVTAASINVKPLAKSKPVKKVETKPVETETKPSEAAFSDVAADKGAPVRAEAAAQSAPAPQAVPQPPFVPMGSYPVMGAPIYQPVPVYYPAPVPVPSANAVKSSSKQVERIEENGVTVRPLQKKKKAELPTREDVDAKLLSAIVEFYFGRPELLELLPEEIKKQIIIRFKR